MIVDWVETGGYVGIGYIWTGSAAVTVEVATPNICITLTAVSRLDISLVATERLGITLEAPEC